MSVELLVFLVVLVEHKGVGSDDIDSLREDNLKVEFGALLVSLDLGLDFEGLSVTILNLDFQRLED